MIMSCQMLPQLVTLVLALHTMHVSDIVSRAHKRALAYQRCFTSSDVNTLLRAYIVYVRPLVGHNSVIRSPITLRDIDSFECVQRRFTKRLSILHSRHPPRLRQGNTGQSRRLQ